MRKLMQKAIEARNREAIQKLAQRESEKAWGKSLSAEERAKYYKSLGYKAI